MRIEYPFGKAAFWILIVAIASGVAVAMSQRQRELDRPDLVFLVFAQEHAEAYRSTIAQFEKDHHCKVRIEKIGLVPLQERVRAALEVNAEVPDMLELGSQLMGSVTKGPLKDVGFWDLTDKIRATGLDKRVVPARFSGYTSRGRIFALPHDVHPVMMAYRRDVVEQLGIDVTKLTTWDEFARVGRELVNHRNADGLVEHYMAAFPDNVHDGVQILMLQRGVPLFDSAGNVAFDNETTVDTICWYTKQTEGPTRISFSVSYGQPTSRALMDATCLFYFCPDWQSRQFQEDVPMLAGKLALMPMPAWEPGGRRTSTWGGTGLAITKACKNKELAWQLAMKLYYDKDELAPRFRMSNILPPLKGAWTMPVYGEPRPFWSNQPIGRLYADLAPGVPGDYPNPYTRNTQDKIRDAYLATKLYYRDHGETGMRDYCRDQVHQAAEYVRRLQDRNLFAKDATPAAPGATHE